MAYSIGMEFEWDEAKNSACFERRGFDFAYAVRAVLDPHRIVAQDRRRDYGEDRYRGKEVAEYEHNARQN